MAEEREEKKAIARNTEPVTSLLPSLTGVITFAFCPSLLGERLCFNLIASAVYTPPCSWSLSLFSSIHPDYTSNGSSSQQPPTVMELCLNEHPCPSTPPLFSPSVFFVPSLNTHSFALPLSPQFEFTESCLPIKYSDTFNTSGTHKKKKKKQVFSDSAYLFYVPQ